MFLSVIIPVYNTESYLQNCFNSLYNQDIDNEDYELIVVNDGSTDSSLQIIEENKERFAHFTLFNQKNSGQSVARNNALKAAQGQYIWFVDSDDFIEPYCLGTIRQILNRFLPDVFAFCADDVFKKGNVQRQHYHDYKPDSIIPGLKFLTLWQYRNCVPFYLFQRNFFQKYSFCFKEGIIHEDNELLPQIFYRAKQVYLYDKILYHINLSEFSTMRSEKPKRSFNLLTVACSLTDFMNQNVEEKDKKFFAQHIAFAVNGSLRYAQKLPHSKRVELENMWKEHRTVFSSLRESCKLKYKAEGFLLKYFPTQMFWLIRLWYSR